MQEIVISGWEDSDHVENDNISKIFMLTFILVLKTIFF